MSGERVTNDLDGRGGRAAGTVADQPRLAWDDPAGASRSLALTRAVTIGRGANNDIVLPDKRASRHHATLAPAAATNGAGTAPPADAGAWVLTDQGSRNGTRVNGTPLDGATPLRDGDRIEIGGTVFTFTAPPPPRPQEPAPAAEPPRVVAAGLAPDGSSLFNLSPTAAGWVELPGGERRILGGETRIGRAVKNDITLDDDKVSRNHAHIRRIDGRFVISDLGSANGVCVNDEPVLTPRELADGDRIEIGDALLRFSLAPFEAGATGEIAIDGGSATGFFDRSLADGLAPLEMKGDLRHVTVLFADMHGFTAMSERLNSPETTTRIINQVFETLTAEIVRYDGSIDKYTGDNIMALFGAPRAHEDDPERAVKAALAMQRALGDFNRRLRRQFGLSLQIRIGINTGETLFGQVGGGAFRSYTVMGDTVNLASRLEHAARVGHILVGETTYALTKGAFHYTALPPMDIKGKREPVRAFEVVREKRADEILHQPAGTDYLIGREAELQRLRAALGEVGGGRGRLLAIVGDAGIGKSQLLAAFRRAGGAAPSPAGDGTMESDPTWIIERCLSYEATAPYSLLSGLLRSLLGLDCEEELDRQKLLGALKATLDGAPGSFDDETRAEYLALLGQILGVQIANPYIAGLEAKVRRKLIGAMVRTLAIARSRPGGQPRPLVLVLEEMQWADGPSVDALDDLIDAIPGLPILLLLTYRPEWSHDWQARSFYDVIKLGELTPEQSRQFLRQQLPAAALPDAVADAIIAQCGNNPLLLEETAKSLQERRVLVPKKGEWVLTADVSLLNIPSTLRGIMMARMDRLSERDRATLQKAAIIGRTFTYAILATIVAPDGGEGADAPDGVDALDDSLAALKAEEFIVENPLAAEPEYSFKHTVVQEIAYNNTLAADRRVLHGRVGEAVERINAERLDDQLETLAHHYARSGNKLKAIEYLTRSGEKARRLGANDGAIEQFEEALEKLRSLPVAELARQGARLTSLHEQLGDVRLLGADFRAAQENYEAGLTGTGTPPLDRARLWNKLGLVWERRGEVRKALGSYEQGLALLQNSAPGTPAAVLAALRVSAARAHALQGAYPVATELAEAVLSALEGAFGPDDRRVRAEALHVLGLTAYAAGRPDDALEHHLHSLQLRREFGDTMGMQESYHELGAIYWSRGQFDRAFEHLTSLTAVLRLNGDSLGAGGRRASGDAPTKDKVRLPTTPAGATPPAPPAAGDGDAPIERYYRSGLAVAERTGDLWGVAVGGARLGDMLYRGGDYERALGYLRKATVEAERIGARGVAAAASITLGAILTAQGYGDAGLQHLERGITWAEAVEIAVTLAEGQLRLAEARLALGDPTGAGAAAERGFAIAARIEHRPILGLARRVLGRVATARGDWAGADRHFRAALDLLNDVDAQGEIGRTLRDFAAMWRAWSSAGHGALPAGVTMMLQRAVQIFENLDMQADLRESRAALLAP